MTNRKLGTQGLEVAPIGLGTMGMTMAYGAGDEEGGIATIRRAHELGVTLFDTAELYGNGTGSNEKICATWTPTTSTCSTSTAWTPTCRSRTWPAR